MKADERSVGKDAPSQKSYAEEIFAYAVSSPQQPGQAERRVPTYILRSMVERCAPVRSCIEIIGREVTRTTKYYDRCFDFYPKDPEGDGEIGPDDPKRNEYRALEQLLLMPDRKNRRSFQHILKANVTDLLTYDDFFTSIAYGDDGMPMALYAEDAGNIAIRYDKKGNIGDDTYFCDSCPLDREFTAEEAQRHGMKCPDHRMPLKETAYVQFIESAGRITARWAENEMIHGHLFHAAARLNGTPLLLSLMLPVGNILLMNEWFNDSYRDQRTPQGLTVFKGTPNESVKRLAQGVEKGVALNPHAMAWVGLPENKDVQFIKMLDTPVEMQSLDWYKNYIEEIHRTFGVAPVVGGIIESGKSGQQPDMQRATNANFIAAIQICLAETYTNSALFEAFNVVNWYMGFPPGEEEDELMEAQTSGAWASAAAAWRNAGYDTALDEDGRVYPTEKSAVIPSAGGFPPESGFSQPPTLSANVNGPAPGQAPANAFEGNPKMAGKAARYDDLVLLMKSAPGPRNIDPAAAIAGLRKDELEFYRNLDDTYRAIIDNGIARMAALKDPTAARLQKEADQIVAELRQELVKSARISVDRLYSDGFKAGGVGVEWTAREDAAVDYLFNKWPGVQSVLPEFGNAQQRAFSDAIAKTFTEPGKADWHLALDEMRKVSDGESWKLARIARSEATYIANQGRAQSYKTADPMGTALYDWIPAPDACDGCMEFAANGPYTLDELMTKSNGGSLHPNERCTFVLRPMLGGV
jgi:hypothetical protein